jgi:GNAT superfamily N-acetyltransferase
MRLHLAPFAGINPTGSKGQHRVGVHEVLSQPACPPAPLAFNEASYRLACVGHIRRCRDDEREEILRIVNAAAEAYRGVIPADRWHEPYMPREELDDEIAAGVAFWGYEDGGKLIGIMGIQDVGDLDLIRHAYVLPARQGRGVGGALVGRLADGAPRRMLVGTWVAAEWAIRFYERHGFALVSPELKAELLRTYWTIPERQVETSVVLAKPPL